jgi:hypothetical protein
MTETIPSKKLNGLPPGLVHHQPGEHAMSQFSTIRDHDHLRDALLQVDAR